MYYALSVVTGMIISVMIMINGMFANHSGVYTSAFLIHLSGFAAISTSYFEHDCLYTPTPAVSLGY